MSIQRTNTLALLLALLGMVLVASFSIKINASEKEKLLEAAVLNNDINAAANLIESGADANSVTTGFKKRPFFHIAVEKGNKKIVELLLENGADPNLLDARGSSGIDYAILHYELPIVELLVEKGAIIDVKYGTGEDQLMSAVFNRDRPMVHYLKTNGATASTQAIVTMQCARCHNTDGTPNHYNIAHIAGQRLQYLRKQLYDFRSGARESIRHEYMNYLMYAVDNDMIEAVARYYHELPRTERASVDLDRQAVQLGEVLFHEGNANSGLPACISCHGSPTVKPKSDDIPILQGLNPQYIKIQLERFKSARRQNDADNIMRSIAALLTDEQIEGLAFYLRTSD